MASEDPPEIIAQKVFRITMISGFLFFTAVAVFVFADVL